MQCNSIFSIDEKTFRFFAFEYFIVRSARLLQPTIVPAQPKRTVMKCEFSFPYARSFDCVPRTMSYGGEMEEKKRSGKEKLFSTFFAAAAARAIVLFEVQ